MRTIFLLLIFAAILVATVGAPQAGVLGWTWLTLMDPHRLTWSFLTTAPLNMILAVVTLLSWFVSSQPKRLPLNLATGLWLCFIAWMTVTTVFSLAPDTAWIQWNFSIRVMLLGILVACLMTNQVRMQALIWVIVLSLGYFAVKGGGFTLVTGGGSHVLGPPGTELADNNNLALAFCMLLPLMNYLQMQSEWRLVRFGMVGAMGLTAVAILGTYSRGGFVGLAIMGAYLWWKSKRKVAIAVVGLAMIVPAVKFMPETWTSRMSTIQSADSDESFEGRVGAWQFALHLALDRPLGGGFNATEVRELADTYPSAWIRTYPPGRAAHSIYFEVLGDHGFIGLALYLGLLATIWRYVAQARRAAKRRSDLAWANDLGTAIQVSLVAFVVCGALLSMAYYDLVYLLIGLSIALRELVRSAETSRQSSAATPQSGRSHRDELLPASIRAGYGPRP
jgi:putative inorganic carbon (HCO3(-)) transporter